MIMNIDTLLTKNFRMSEFVRIEDVEHVDDIIEKNIITLAKCLQSMRDVYFNSPMIITSGYRTIERNKKIGGARHSLHLSGRAADVQVKGLQPRRVYEILDGHWTGGLGLYVHHVHIDIGGYRRWHDLRQQKWNHNK